MMEKMLSFWLLVLGFGLLDVSAQTETSNRPIPKSGTTISKGVVNNLAVSLPNPVYPPAAEAVRARGAVKVQVLIDEAGNVINAAAVSGHPFLRASAVNAAREARFKPILLSGTPVKVTGVIVYNFIPSSADEDDETLSTTAETKSDNDSENVEEESDETQTFAVPVAIRVVNDLAIDLVKPEYPASARAVRASDEVSVKVLIDEEGSVVSAEAVSGHPLLHAAAVNAALLSKFRPASSSGQPVKVEGVVVYNFVP